MISNEVKSFECYGEGWVKKKDIDLNKLAINKGYTISIKKFGNLDPLVGTIRREVPWWNDAEFVGWLIESTDNVDEFKNTKQIKDLVSTLTSPLLNKGNGLSYILFAGMINKSRYYIVDALESIGLCTGTAVFGITDEEYFTQVLTKTKMNEDSYDIVLLG